MLQRRRLASLVAVVLLVACGERPDGRGDGGPITASIVVTPATARLTAGGPPLELSAALSCARAEITWALDGPGTLSSTSGPRAIYTPPARLVDDGRATITASAAGTSGMASIVLAPGPTLEVAGRVVDIGGTPLSGITVTVGERSTVTDDSGRFSLQEITAPYSLTAFSMERNEALVYEGLTRSDLTIVWRRLAGEPTRSGEVAGTIDGGVPPGTPGVRTGVVFVSPEAQSQEEVLTRDWVLPVSWSGPSTITGSVHVLQFASPVPGGLPVAFPGYGRQTGVTLQDGLITPRVDVSLTLPAVSTIEGRYVLPEGSDFFASFISLRFEDGANLFLGFDNGPGPDFVYATPAGIGASVVLTEVAFVAGATVARRESGIVPGASDLVLGLPEGALPVSPADGADAVDGETEFSWTAFSGGVFIVDFIAPGQGPTFHVVTGATRTMLPRIAAIPLPARTAYAWTVTASAPFESVDEVAGPRNFTPEGNTLFQSFSDFQGFTTR